MNIFQIHNILLMLATIGALVAFFAIQASPSLRTAGPTNPARPLPHY